MMVACVLLDVSLGRAVFRLVIALRVVAVFSCKPLQVVVFPMPWICTTAQPGHGLLLSSAWDAIILQERLLVTWPSLREEKTQVYCNETMKRGIELGT